MTEGNKLTAAHRKSLKNPQKIMNQAYQIGRRNMTEEQPRKNKTYIMPIMQI